MEIGPVTLNYAEGPDNGPPLLLLHAQHMDWYSYSRVLPDLSKSFHVFAVSYHGHGKTRAPVEYMNAAHIGADLAAFIRSVIKEPAYVSGNSSGGAPHGVAPREHAGAGQGRPGTAPQTLVSRSSSAFSPTSSVSSSAR